MSNETNTRTATPTASPLTAQGTQQPVMVKRIGKTTYRVKLHFSETSKETMTDKIKRLILNDCAKEFEQSEKNFLNTLDKAYQKIPFCLQWNEPETRT